MTPETLTSVVVVASGLLAAYLLGQLLQIYAENRALFEWWRGCDPEGRARRYINLWRLLARSQGSGALYWLQGCFLSPEQAQLTEAQTRFLTGTLFKFQRYTDAQGVQQGLLTPKHCVDSILLAPGDGDAPFEAWLKRSRLRGKPRSAAVPLTFAARAVTREGVVFYDYEPVPSREGVMGVYPAADDVEGWRGLVQLWLNGPGDDKTWGWAQDGAGQWLPTPFVAGQGDAANWFDVARNPDNVLARYGIGPRAALVVFFCTGTYSVGSMKVDSVALGNLLAGSGSNAGGWLGLMQGLGPQVAADEIQELVYSEVASRFPPRPPRCRVAPAARVAQGATAFFSSFLPMAAMALLPGAGAALLPILAASAAAGGVSAYGRLSASAFGC